MTLHEFPRLGERYWEQRLENGLLLRVVPKPGFARSYAFLGVDYGSIDTSFTRGGIPCRTPDGVAHYLEHKMFDLPEDNAMNLFAAHGGYPNAFTGYAMTAYYFDCTEQCAENLRILLRMVLTPWFPAESVEKERGIIAQEIRMYEDSADSRAYEDLFGAMFAHHPIRVPIAGTVESIGKITPQVLQDCHAAFYAPANLMLCVTGDVDPALVEEIARAESANAHAEPVPVRDYGPVETMTCPTQRTVRHMEIAMPTFCLGFKCEPPARGLESMRREIIGDLAAEILVGESSALYTRLYDEGLINSDFSAGYESVRDACLFSAGGDSRDPDAVLRAILDEAQRLSCEGFDRALFDRLIRSSLGRRTRDLDSFESVCYRMCAYHFDGVDYFSFPEAYASVTPEDVLQFIRQVIRPERAALSIILPNESEESA